MHRGPGGTGVVGVLERGAGSRVTGLRADMDALQLQDNGNQPWKSTHEGIQPLHHSAYDFNDELIPYGIRALTSIVRHALRTEFPC